jgi:hypothetical protein
MRDLGRALTLAAALGAGCAGNGGHRTADAAADGVADASAAPVCQPTSACTFCVSAELSPTIATVGIVTWTSDLPELAEAHVDFGLTTDYGMTAPVDLGAADHRTLLLGMRQRKQYHFRVVAASGTATCASPDYTLTTGTLLNGLPKLFNNNSKAFALAADMVPGTGDGAIALEVSLDLATRTATTVWSYHADPGIQNDRLGDVQRLSNGNTLVAFSTAGALQESSPDGVLLREWSWPLGATFGFMQARATLYGPPPR